MYIFAKFVADHIFLQNRDKINIKNSKGNNTGPAALNFTAACCGAAH
jgi:hypothetical protein